MKGSNNSNKSIISYLWKFLLIIAVTITIFFPASKSSDIAYADMGPKPSVHITFENMGDEICYGTLLSKTKSTGPASVWDEEVGHEYIPNDFTHQIWEAFAEYNDTDGYYFLQVGWKCNDTKSLTWGYYPPSNFKILLYYPESESFVVSESYERYAFDSYYTVNMAGINISEVMETATPTLVAEKSYDYTLETVFLVCRIVITILLEIGIALLFGFKQKKLLGIITVTNVVTQIALNVALNVIRFYEGALLFIIFYVLLEIIVFAIEAIVYGMTFKRVSPKKIPVWKSVLYAFVSNVLSFGVGFLFVIVVEIM